MDAISCLAPLPAASFADATTSSSSVTSHRYYSPLLRADQFASYARAVTRDSSVLGVAAVDYYSSSSPAPAPAPGGGRRLAPAGARAGKRRLRASKRAPTTYISTDPSNFRFMVQQVTGVQAEPTSTTAASQLAADTAAFDASVLMAADATNPLMLMTAGDHHEQQQQQPCFPTLDSWNVSMYERNGLLGGTRHYCT